MERMSVLAPMIVLMTRVSGDLWFVIASGGENQVLFRLSDQKAITLQEAVPDLASVKVILVGELHNGKKHHDIQLEVIRALHGAGLWLAVGMEMSRRESQEVLDQWVGGEPFRSAVHQGLLRQLECPLGHLCGHSPICPRKENTLSRTQRFTGNHSPGGTRGLRVPK